MTSRTSSVKSYPALSLFKTTLKKQTAATLLVTAFSLLICPGTTIREALWYLTNLYPEEKFQISEHLQFASVFSLGLSVALVFLLYLINFNFLFSKKTGDLFHSLPLTRNELLFSRALPAYIGGLFTMTLSFLGFCAANLMPAVEPAKADLLVTTYLLMVLFLTALSAFLLLFFVCSGGIFDTIIAILVVSVAPAAIGAILNSVAENVATGVIVKSNWLIYVCPFAFAFFKLASYTDNYHSDYHGNIIEDIEKVTIWSVLGTLLFAVICIVLCIRLFKIRKSETAGSAYSFKFLPFILGLFVSMVGGYVIGIIFSGDIDSLNPLFWIFFTVGAILCAVAFGAISTRGFKKVPRSLLNGGIAVAIMIALTTGTTVTATIAESKVPKAENVKSVEVGYNETAVFCDPEDIKLVVDIHKSIVDNVGGWGPYEHNDYSSFSHNFGDFRLKYTMKNGTVIERDYYMALIQNKSTQLLKLMKTEEFFAKFSDITVTNAEVNFDAYFVNKESGITKEELRGVLTASETEEFIAIFKSELMKADDSVFNEECYDVNLVSEKYYGLYLPLSFTKSINYLENHISEDNTEFYK